MRIGNLKFVAMPLAFALVAASYAMQHWAPASKVVAQPSATTQTSCSTSLLGGERPQLPDRASTNGTELCYSAFAVLHSPLSRTPLWSAELLDPARMAAARGMERASRFHEEERLPEDQRADLSDYARSGYDRGHLAPSADMPDASSQSQSFSLANIVPQDAELNRGDWADLEADVRSLARRRDSVYVVTGVTFDGREVDYTPSGRVMVPTTMWKAVASPGEGSAVWSARNSSNARLKRESLASFTARTGIDPFPALSAGDRARMLDAVR